jgi:hypothetical protein
VDDSRWTASEKVAPQPVGQTPARCCQSFDAALPCRGHEFSLIVGSELVVQLAGGLA